MRMKKSLALVIRFSFVCIIILAGLFGIVGTNGGSTHGAMKVSATMEGPWILTNDGAIYAYNNSEWIQKEPPGTAVDFSICSNFLFILTQSDASGEYNVKSRNIYETSWTTYPSLGTIDATCVACDGAEPVVITTTTTKSVYKYYNNSQSWRSIHDGATEISVENGRLFYLYPTTTNGNVWSRQVDGGTYKRWGETFVGNKIAGDANGHRGWPLIMIRTHYVNGIRIIINGPLLSTPARYMKWISNPM